MEEVRAGMAWRRVLTRMESPIERAIALGGRGVTRCVA